LTAETLVEAEKEVSGRGGGDVSEIRGRAVTIAGKSDELLGRLEDSSESRVWFIGGVGSKEPWGSSGSFLSDAGEWKAFAINRKKNKRGYLGKKRLSSYEKFRTFYQTRRRKKARRHSLHRAGGFRDQR